MWLFCFFDLPTNTKADQKTAAEFRKSLLKDGFNMMQYSVYTRFCGSKEAFDVHKKRIAAVLPEKGFVSMLGITDKQYGDIANFCGIPFKKILKTPQQLEFF